MTSRSPLIPAAVLILLASAVLSSSTRADEPAANLALVAKADASFATPHDPVAGLNDGNPPKSSRDRASGAYANYPRRGTQWVEYEWPRPVHVDGASAYWWADGRGIALPAAARLEYFDGTAFKPVPGGGVGVEKDRFNTTTFAPVRTTKLRLVMDAADGKSTGVIEWKVTGDNADEPFAPLADAGPDRTVVLPAKTFLAGRGRDPMHDGRSTGGRWQKAGGPGDVTFENAASPNTAATFSTPGVYTLSFGAEADNRIGVDVIRVYATAAPKAGMLRTVFPSHYKVDSAFWTPRLKAQIVNWIPHCIAKLETPGLPEGGFEWIVEAGKQLRGEPSRPQKCRPWVNAYVFNVVESMSVALTLDANGDKEIEAAQDAFRKKLDIWIPAILAAQEPDGYFQTRFTLGTPGERERGVKPQRWNPKTAGEHEGYIAGYFIEAGIAHYVATEGKDRRLYDAARKLADCWDANIGPAPKKPWVDGHQGLEQAMVRLGRFVNDTEGAGKGQKYIDLGKFLLDCRGHTGQPTASPTGAHADFYAGAGASAEYNQNHLPIQRQYTGVGHAVRASYTYSALADVAAETGDPAYWSAALSIWDNIVHKKLYVTGGIGSGETAEGFGSDYSLPNKTAYVESCSSCGLLFMQHKLNAATRNAKYADLYETTLYNAILGDVDLPGNNFTYTNALDSSTARYPWHGCPCCVGNIPRVLLMLPTWTYATGDDALYVNLFLGSTVDVGKVAGTDVSVVQKTDYPWKGNVAMTINPKQPATFTLNVRSPDREVSTLYKLTPAADGITWLKVNGQPVETKSTDGYVAIRREWKAGDTIEFELPLPPQTITADPQIAATRGLVAFARGPLIYNLESADTNVELAVGTAPKLTPDWQPQLLGGIVRLTGTFADGSPLVAVPNYARLNRGGRSLVWAKR